MGKQGVYWESPRSKGDTELTEYEELSCDA